MSESDDSAVSAEVKAIADQVLRDTKIRVLMASTSVLTDQIAELTLRWQELSARIGHTGEKVGGIEKTLSDNNDLLVQMLDIVKAVRGGIKVLGWLGVLAKWVTAVAAAAGVVYAAYQLVVHGSVPPPTK